MKNFFIILLILLSSFIPFLVLTVYAEVFESNGVLKIGSTGNDVKTLQTFLNKDSETKVSVTGAGSPGNETTYFGPATDVAVKKFQTKYANDVLLPAGLTQPTGVAGQYTKNKLISLYGNNASVTANESLNNSVATENKSTFYGVTNYEFETTKKYFGNLFKNNPNVSVNPSEITNSDVKILQYFSETPRVYNATPFQNKPGSTTVISGTGFLETNNTFIVGDSVIDNVSCYSSTMCNVKLPDNISEGDKKIVLQNKNGNSRNQGFDTKLKISNNPISPTQLISISPSKITAKQKDIEITLTGKGFAKTGNYISVPMGSVGPYTSENDQIKFKLTGAKDTNLFFDRITSAKATSIGVPIMVSNEYGPSNFIMLEVSYE